MISKGTLHFKYVPKEYTKQRQTKEEEEIKEESYLNYITITNY